MRPILILQHSLTRPPAYFADYLARAGLASMTVLLRDAADLPDSALLARCAGIAVLDDDDTAPPTWRERELALLGAARDAGQPLCGLGSGAELVARAAGAEQALPGPPAVGWLPVMLRPAAAHEPWLSCLGTHPHTVFTRQHTALRAPPQALELLSGPQAPCQAFVLGATLGIRFHAELNLASYRAWLPQLCATLPAPAAGVHTAAELAQDVEQRIRGMRALADALYAHWVSQLSS